MKRFAMFLALLAGAVAPLAGLAKIPDNYGPIVIEDQIIKGKRHIDLRPALALARETNRPILLYIGAYDCPPCRFFNTMLERNLVEMKPLMDQYVLVDIRTWLKGPRFEWQVTDGEPLSTEAFFQKIGYTGKPKFPSYIFFDMNFKQVRQVPEGVDITDNAEAFKSVIR